MWLGVVGDGSRWQPVRLPIGTVLAVPVAGCTSVLQVGKIIFGARLVRQCASECAHILAARPHDGNRIGLAGRPRAARHQQVTAQK
jgi:hypothetical protein